MVRRAWTEQDSNELKKLYMTDKVTDPDELAEYFGKNRRSIISKLTQLKIYVPVTALQKRKVTVNEMIGELEDLLNIELDTSNLSKRDNIEKILKAVKQIT